MDISKALELKIGDVLESLTESHGPTALTKSKQYPLVDNPRLILKKAGSIYLGFLKDIHEGVEVANVLLPIIDDYSDYRFPSYVNFN